MNEFKCPCEGCNKSYDKKWKLINHIRQSRSGTHGEMGKLPPGFNPDSLTIGEPETSENVKPEVEPSENQNMNVEIIKPPKKKPIETLTCPDCGSPKADWIRIEETRATEEQKRIYQYVCGNCHELIRVTE